jgi:hypothetical protein
MYKTSLVITNRTVEIERDGANLFFTALTCGIWYLCCQSASIEIYEIQRIQTLYCKDGVIVGEIQPTGCFGRGRFVIDLPEDGDKSTKDLFFELKEAWHAARHSMMNGADDHINDQDETETMLLRD